MSFFNESNETPSHRGHSDALGPVHEAQTPTPTTSSRVGGATVAGGELRQQSAATFTALGDTHRRLDVADVVFRLPPTGDCTDSRVEGYR